MKVLVLNGSACTRGGTAAMAAAFARGAREAGHEVDMLDIARMEIHGCLGCEYCHTRGGGVCMQHDDMDAVYPLWDAADVIVMASPIYYGSFSGQMHCLVHRTYAGDKPKLQGNGASVVLRSHGRLRGNQTDLSRFHAGLLSRARFGCVRGNYRASVDGRNGDTSRRIRALTVRKGCVTRVAPLS